jgi:hypothetical protein
LLEYAAQILPDGGLPGHDEEERVWRSFLLLGAFLAAGNSVDAGPFRLHVRRLVKYVEGTMGRGTPPQQRQLMEQGLAKAKKPAHPAPECAELALRFLTQPPTAAPPGWEKLARTFSPLLQ